MTTARATSFSGLKDLVAYIDCLLAGGTETHCYSKGDNGRGAWGDVVATIAHPMVALPVSEMEAKFGHGNSHEAKGKLVTITLQGGQPFQAQVMDKAPAGVVDLNPGALIAAGLPMDTELDVPAVWEWA